MLHYYYVYLIKNENRLVITNYESNDSNWHLLMDNNGTNINLLYQLCLTYCIGVIDGSNSGLVLTNSREEFNMKVEF